MILSESKIDIKSGQPLEVDVYCDLHEQLFEYAVYRGAPDGSETLVGDAFKRPLMNMDNLRRELLYPVDALFGPIPICKANRVVRVAISTLGWGQVTDDPDSPVYYVVRFRSIWCKKSLGTGPRFDFPAVFEQDQADEQELYVNVFNSNLIPQTKIAALPANSPIEIVDAQSKLPTQVLYPGCLYVICINFEHLVLTFGDQALKYLSAVTILYRLYDINGASWAELVSSGSPYSEKELTTAFRYLMFPSETAAYYEETGSQGTIWAPNASECPATLNSAIVGDTGLPALEMLFPDVASLQDKIAGWWLQMPFHVPYALPLLDNSGQMEFVLEAPAGASGMTLSKPCVVKSNIVLWNKPESPPTKRTMTIVFVGQYATTGGVEDPDFAQWKEAHFPTLKEFLQDSFASFGRGLLGLSVEDAIYLDLDSVVQPQNDDGTPFLIEGVQADLVGWFKEVQSKAEDAGYAAWPTDEGQVGSFVFRCMAVQAYSWRFCQHFDPGTLVGNAITALKSNGGLPTGLELYSSSEEYEHILALIVPFYTPPLAPGGPPLPNSYAYSPDLPVMKSLSNSFTPADISEGHGFYFDFTSLVPTKDYLWDPVAKPFLRNSLFHEISHGSLGGFGMWKPALVDYGGYGCLPFPSEPVLLSAYGRLRAANDVANYAGKVLGGNAAPGTDVKFGFGTYDLVSALLLGPQVYAVRVDGFDWPNGGSLQFWVKPTVWCVYGVYAVSVEIRINDEVFDTRTVSFGWHGKIRHWSGHMEFAIDGVGWPDKDVGMVMCVKVGVSGRGVNGEVLWAWDENEIELHSVVGS